ncbi:MAG TPA: hypothetical protein VGA52_10325 [Anaerolineales bacterium]|jgi:hypothetical protein
MSIYLTPITHVLPLTKVRRVRRLPVAGTVTVRVSERVQAQDVVAEAELAPRHYFLDLSRGLGVPVRETSKYLVRARGDHVDIGDVIAGPVGIARRTVRAPADGRIASVADGRVLFQARGRPYELRAGFPGQIVATDGFRSVTLETTAALLQAVWGNGRQDFGVLRMVGDGPGSRLQPGGLDMQLRGAVLVAGYADNPAPLHQATELSVRGLILGGLSSALIPVVRRLPYPVLVMEGFGELPISEPIYTLLKNNAGREAALEGRPSAEYETGRPEVIIPLPANREVEQPEEVTPLEPGLRVRTLRGPERGAVGVVREILAKAVGYPSGILARSAIIDVQGVGPVTIPLANLEVLQ